MTIKQLQREVNSGETGQKIAPVSSFNQRLQTDILPGGEKFFVVIFLLISVSFLKFVLFKKYECKLFRLYSAVATLVLFTSFQKA